ncbi:MAG: glutamate racemase [Fusobacteriaceae bacterium]|nr:glutamate racemase [Fusobacteriaceae bacterium]MBP9510845.1 glutamate racemase [Fusobacteriaceae bacterium]
MKNLGKIGVFDSGVGGITVLKRIREIFPNEGVVYYGDTLYSPYGEKTKEEIQQRCLKIRDFFIEKGCKAVVIACNTATVAALEELKLTSSIPVIGVIHPGALTAVNGTTNNRVGVIATPFTVKNLAYTKEIKKIDEEIEVFEAGCKLFCSMIEKGWETFDERFTLLEEYLSPIPNDIDTLVLGCTHYPLILNDIEKYFKGRIVDPAFETAKELKLKLEELSLLSDADADATVEYYVSGDKEVFKSIAESFLGDSIESIETKVV